jgi:hypothetical protein
MVEAKVFINKVIASGLSEGYEYPSSLAQCKKLIFKFNQKIINPKTNSFENTFTNCQTIYDYCHELTYRECNVHYETDQSVAESLFERITLICFGKQINKLGCEYILLWQHCYKSIFTFADETDAMEQQSNSDKVKSSVKRLFLRS